MSGPNKNGVVTIVAETDLTDLTGIRLEVLTDLRNPNKGPGRAPDGNFVLTELELTAAPKADPKKPVPVKLQAPLADFAQANFEVAKAIDGNSADPVGGWAVSPATGVVHWATFETKEPVGKAGGTVLTFSSTRSSWECLRTRPVPPLRDTRRAADQAGVPDEFRTYLAPRSRVAFASSAIPC